ncbi:hypothetical protein HZA57_08355 [Candidatus Poribacteria bacterium]|nr:hypothetical protein [Candidatus Poribacteria bacterium]
MIPHASPVRDVFVRLLAASLLFLAAGVVHGQETTYNSSVSNPSQPETTYQGSNTRQDTQLVVGMISSRVESDEWAEVVHQIESEGEALKPTLSARTAARGEVTLDQQFAELGKQDIEVWLVDSPDPERARAILSLLSKLGSKVVLLTESQPAEPIPGCQVLVTNPVATAMAAAEAASHAAGRGPGQLWVLAGSDPALAQWSETFRLRLEMLQSDRAPVVKDPSGWTAADLIGQLSGAQPGVSTLVVADPKLTPMVRAAAAKLDSSPSIILVGLSRENFAAADDETALAWVRPDMGAVARAIADAPKSAPGAPRMAGASLFWNE